MKTKALIIGIIIIAIIGFAVNKRSDNAPTVVTPATNDTTGIQKAETDSYTMAEVATHNTQADCWTTISGSVYNVTSWISEHPGGAKAIIGLCGIDGTAGFTGQHGGQPRPATELAGFKIGALAN
ncbi:MAG: cytochrome b5 domain-containing protein [Candidatus Pacebacteria bacterium]|jgi:cytochrome b involved in lipid metabolism|nr:cytochrome b5 domain-containing protein [Candidatus Paceibacterota bacterium]